MKQVLKRRLAIMLVVLLFMSGIGYRYDVQVNATELGKGSTIEETDSEDSVFSGEEVKTENYNRNNIGIASVIYAAFEDYSLLKNVTAPSSVWGTDKTVHNYRSLNNTAAAAAVIASGENGVARAAELDASGNIASGTEDGGINWTLSGDGTLTISGNGKMNNYTDYENYPGWFGDDWEYMWSIKSLVILDGVTSIGDQAFAELPIKSVIIPDSVTSIGERAFTYCSELESVVIPDSVTIIGSDAFRSCYNMDAVSIGRGVTDIGERAFAYCDALESINIPDSVITIGEGAFVDCPLTTVSIGKGVTTIGEYAFANNWYTDNRLKEFIVDSANTAYSAKDGVLYNKDQTKLIQYPAGKSGASYVIGKSVTSIAYAAFEGSNNLKEVSIPSSVTSIGDAAFYDCRNLNSIVIPDKVTSIGARTFAECISLENMIIPENVTKIGMNAFDIPDYYYDYESGTRYDGKGMKTIRILNDKCSIYDLEGTIASSAVIYGYSNSTAESYAKKYNRVFNALDNTDIAKCTITLASTSYTYDGNAKKPSITVKNGQTNLAEGTDFTVAYTDNKNVGNATVTITGKGRYTGKTVKTYTIKPAGTSISKLVPGKNSFSVEWKEQATQTTGYQIQYSTSESFNDTLTKTISSNKTLSKVILSLKEGVKYYVRVRTYKTVGSQKICSDWSSVKSVTTDKIVTISSLSTPKLTGVSNVSTGVKISWGKVSGAQKYRVYSKIGSGSWTKIGETTGTSYTWTGAKSGTTYRYTVRCISSDGKSFTSSYDSTGLTLKYVAAPKLTGVSNVSTGVKISWGKVTGAVTYRVYSKVGSGSWTKIGETTGTSYTWKGAKSGTTYRYTVRCISSDGKSFISSYDSTGLTLKYVAAPKLTSVNSGNTGVKIVWGKVSGAQKYRVYSKTGSGSWKKIGETTGTSYTWKGAKNNTTYKYTVRCISNDGKSFMSGYDSNGLSLKSVAIPKLTKASKVSNGVKISWSKVTGAGKYRVYYKIGSGNWKKIGETTGTSYTWTGAKKGIAYRFTVRCITSNGKNYMSGYDSKGLTIQ